ncbi:unnamed protein product, partial [Hapterophycus canaliculatus]
NGSVCNVDPSFASINQHVQSRVRSKVIVGSTVFPRSVLIRDILIPPTVSGSTSLHITTHHALGSEDIERRISKLSLMEGASASRPSCETDKREHNASTYL